MRERSAATLSERDRAALGDIGGEVERLTRLTRDLVDLAAERPLAAAPTQVGELLAESARATERAFPDIAVECEIAPLPPLEADAARLRQVFANLLANAAQAQRAGEIHVHATSDRRAIRVVVQDRGPGIPDEVSGRLFDLYFTTKSGGTGLGLAIARRFVERHGGTLVHLRERKPGAAFEVMLPIRHSNHAAVGGDSQTADGGLVEGE
jgi:signal transduction histidine kinase